MSETRNIKVPIGCPHYAIDSLLLLTSVITLVVGLALKYEFLIFGNYLEYYLGKPIFFLLVGSVAIFADASLGIISLWRRSYRGVITFVVCTMYLFASMFALVTLTYVFSISSDETMYARLKEDMKNFTNNSDTIDTIRVYLNCCGYEKIDDWKNHTMDIPQSCWIGDAICNDEETTEIRTNGCHDALEIFLNSRKFFVVGILVVLGIIQIISMILSIVVYQDLVRLPVTRTLVDNEGTVSTNIPRIHNPLGHLSTVGNLTTVVKLPSAGNADPYIRRPSHLPVVLDYRSPHESFLRQEPQLRFDRRVMLPNSRHKNPYAVRPG